ncbi:MAG: NADP-dependent phosphogluconate dehydrogenase [Chloroflexi bacterium]|nr:MAG: NADP-dependent phosphogluconate dehydrogenase [Chloroflexota bacterium]
MPEKEIGVVGLGTIGAGLARNFASHGVRVAVYNRTHRRTEQFIADHSQEGDFVPAATLEELARVLQPPRAVAVLVNAGRPVDDVIDELTKALDKDDVIIDGGNSFFQDTQRRAAALEKIGFGFERVEEMLTAIAAKVDGVPCCTYIGPDGAGHFVKMVHNGIEYADIQLIAETYDLLRNALGLAPDELASVFREWNEGRLQSYLIEITSYVLAKHDDGSGAALVDGIEDEAEQKGTGRWTSQSALELGVPLTGITEAVFARMLSSQKAQRVKASGILTGPAAAKSASGLVDDVQEALYASKIVAYAQGFEHLAAGSREFRWDLDLGALATIWRDGCIIRAKFLSSIKDAYEQDPHLANLMLAPFFQDALAKAQPAWRRVVKAAVDHGIPIPAFASSLGYYDGYRRARGPANLIQGLRDYFGSHTYHRVDRAGAYHTRWAQGGEEVKTD